MDGGNKRKPISPLHQQTEKIPKMDDLDKIIGECDHRITQLKKKKNPSLADLMEQVDITSTRTDAKASRERMSDRIELEEIVIPRIVNAILNERLTAETRDGGSIFEAVQYTVHEESDELRGRLDLLEKQLKDKRNTACFVPNGMIFGNAKREERLLKLKEVS